MAEREDHRPGSSDEHVDISAMLDLAHGLVDDDEKAVLLEHIAACANCEDSFREQVGQLERGRILWSDIGVAKPRKQNRHRRSRFSSRWSVALAAAAVIVLLVVQPWEPPLMPEAQWLPLPNEGLALRESSSAMPENLSAGLHAYEKQDLELALTHLGVECTRPEMERLRKVYFASALLMSERSEDAIGLLANMDLRLLPDPWAGESLWTLYVAHLHAGNADTAKILLEELADEPGWLGERARQEMDSR